MEETKILFIIVFVITLIISLKVKVMQLFVSHLDFSHTTLKVESNDTIGKLRSDESIPVIRKNCF